MHIFQFCGKYLGIRHISKHVNIQEAWGVINKISCEDVTIKMNMVNLGMCNVALFDAIAMVMFILKSFPH